MMLYNSLRDKLSLLAKTFGTFNFGLKCFDVSLDDVRNGDMEVVNCLKELCFNEGDCFLLCEIDVLLVIVVVMFVLIVLSNNFLLSLFVKSARMQR